MYICPVFTAFPDNRNIGEQIEGRCNIKKICRHKNRCVSQESVEGLEKRLYVSILNKAPLFPQNTTSV